MESSSKQSTLTRGLRVLEIVSQRGKVTFGELKSLLDLHGTTLNRILKVLVSEGYLMKDESSYIPGLRLNLLGGKDDLWTQLQIKLKRGMEQINSRYHVTLLLITFENHKAKVADKVISPSNLGMLEVGTIREDLANFPWGLLYLGELKEEEQEYFIKHACENPLNNCKEYGEQQIRDLLHEAVTMDYVDDKGLFFRGRRFAVPIRLPNNQLIGAIGAGTFEDILSEEQCKEIISELQCLAEI